VQLPGVVVTIGGVACCAAYSVLARRWVAASDSTAQVVLAQQAYALAFATAAALISTLAGGLARPVGASAIGVGSAVASGLLYYAAAYWCYLGALRRTPASVAATSFYLIPLFGITISFVALGDRFSVPQWLGAAIVLVAVASVMFSDFVRRSVN
jgi:drug/metabolite transporter (DMT)-like permease